VAVPCKNCRGSSPSLPFWETRAANQVEISVPAGMTDRLTVNGNEMAGSLAGMSGAMVRRQR